MRWVVSLPADILSPHLILVPGQSCSASSICVMQDRLYPAADCIKFCSCFFSEELAVKRLVRTHAESHSIEIKCRDTATLLMLLTFILVVACWGLLSVVPISGFGTYQCRLLRWDSLLAFWLTCGLCVLLWLLDQSGIHGLLILVAATPAGCPSGVTLGSLLHVLWWDWLLRTAVTAFPGQLGSIGFFQMLSALHGGGAGVMGGDSSPWCAVILGLGLYFLKIT